LLLTRCTVAIFAYNEEKTIEKTIQSLMDQRMPPSVRIEEVVVVASGCTDKTVSIAKRMAQNHAIIRVIEEAERRGKAAAVNTVLKVAIGDTIALVPGDVILEQNALGALCLALRSDSSIGVVCGRPCPTDTAHTLPSRVGECLWRLHNRTLKLLAIEGISTHASGELMALRKDIVHQIDEETVNEDAYIALYAWRRGFRVAYVETARVFMKAPASIPELIRQRARILCGHRIVRRKLGYYPRTLESMAVYDPARAARILLSEVREFPSELPFLILLVFLETIAHGWAVVSTVLAAEYVRWEQIKSTKDIRLSSNRKEKGWPCEGMQD
jgi:biofilm PGA synthesis N-glycosyltransferase PgaC